MKNLSYALLAVILFSYSQSQSQGEPCALCPDGTVFRSSDAAEEVCSGKVIQGKRQENGNCEPVTLTEE